jgi:hypothetical protein
LCDLKDDSQQLLHKFRELILGGFLGKHGYAIEYERKYGLLDPDWTISKNSAIVAIVEVTNFHAAIAIENELRDGGTEELRSSDKTRRHHHISRGRSLALQSDNPDGAGAQMLDDSCGA